jgi:Family of unknown function (DUF6655)
VRLAVALAALASAALAGCQGGIRSTTTERTATEMLLVSTAAERAMLRLDVLALAGRRVACDFTYLVAIDSRYVQSGLRQRLAEAEAILVSLDDDPDVVLEVRCAGLGTHTGDFDLGIPPLPVTVPGSELLALSPELTLGIHVREGWACLEVWGYDPRTLTLAFDEQRLWGKAAGRSSTDLFQDVYPPFWPWDEEQVTDSDEGGGE